MIESAEMLAEAGLLYMVRVTTRHGSFSVAHHDPSLALKAVADFHAAGFGTVGIYDPAGRKLTFDFVRRAADPHA